MASVPTARGKNAVSSEREAKEKLNYVIHDYLLFVGATTSASSFQNEVGIDEAKVRRCEVPGFLYHWWTLFWDLYSAVPERRESHEPSVEARHFMDLMQHHPPNGVQAQTPFSHPQAAGAVEQQVQTPMAAPPHGLYPQMHSHQPGYNAMPMSPGYMHHPSMRQSRIAQSQQGLSMAPSPGQPVLQSPAMSPGQPQGLGNMQRPVPSSLSLGPPMQQAGYANPALRHPQAGNGVAATPGVMPGLNMVMSAGTPTGGPHPGTPTMAMPARSSPAWQGQMQPAPPHPYNVGPVPDAIPLSAHIHDQNMLRLHAGQGHLQEQPQMLEIQKMKQSLKDEVRPYEKNLLAEAPGDYFQLGLDPSHMHPGAPG